MAEQAPEKKESGCSDPKCISTNYEQIKKQGFFECKTCGYMGGKQGIFFNLLFSAKLVNLVHFYQIY